MMKEYNIAIYPGDGIGREVIPEAVKALTAASEQCGFTLRYTEFDWGCEYYDRTGKVVPDDYLDVLCGFDAILLGSLGDPNHLPDHITLKPLIEIPQRVDQYACLRPAVLLPGVSSPLAAREANDTDMMIVRENSEGESVDVGGFFKHGSEAGIAVQTALHSRQGVERVLRYGFQLASARRRRLTMATKSNALKYGMVLWDEVFAEVQQEYPNVVADKCHVDALAMNFVRCPEKYDVVVASNLLGDILSDLAGAISGGLGLVPSACVNPEKRFPSLFEPVHGSALDIAGKNLANPIGAIRSSAMMLGTWTPFNKLRGLSTLGEAALCFLLCVIGAQGNLIEALRQAPILLLLPLIVVAVHGLVVLFAARAMKIDLATTFVTSISCIGGTASAPIVATVYKKEALIPIGVLLGSLGYAVGNYLGIYLGYFLIAF